MDHKTAVDRYGLLAFDLAQKTQACGLEDHLSWSEFGRVPMRGRKGLQWAVRLHVEPFLGFDRKGREVWGEERLLVFRVDVPPGASEEDALAHLMQVAVTGQVSVPESARRVL